MNYSNLPVQIFCNKIMFSINSIIKIIYFPHIEYIITMKCKLDVFTIFIILLIVLVLFIMMNKWFTLKESKETFIDFNKENAESSSITKYIPQYSTDTNRTLIHLYDNLYFDNKNGAVVEVNSSQTLTPSESLGDSINKIYVISRKGISVAMYPGQLTNNKAKPFDTTESEITTTTPRYDEYKYSTNTLINNGEFYYTIFYYSWNVETFIHLFKHSRTATTVNPIIDAYKLQYIKSYILSPTDGLKYTVTGAVTPNTIPSPLKLPKDFDYTDANNKNSISLPYYLEGKVKVFQITPLVFYDIANGNIILKTSLDAVPSATATNFTVYDRAGGVKTNPTNTNQPTKLTGQPTIFTIGNDRSGMVLVTSFYQNTIISVIFVDNTNSDHAYEIIATQRFNKVQAVNDLATDTDPTATTAPATTAPATTPPGGWNEWNKNFNNKWNDQYNAQMNCGSDKSCWYWFFKSLPSFQDKNDMSNMYGSNGQSFFSDDYFLKTEAVPPVCPQCPNCPTSGTGTCTSCGGNGGSGTTLSSCSPVDLHLTPILSTKYTDNLGNIYIATTDNSGNKSYRLEGKMTTGGTASTGGTTSTNTIGTSVTSLDNNISGVANNVINTAGGVVGTAGNLAYSAGSGAVNLLKDTGSGAVDLLKDTGSGAINLLKDTGSGALGLLKDTGSGISHLGSGGLQMQGSQYNSAGAAGATGSAGAQMGTTSDKTFGKMPGQTPVDNYSYYGALQSKGGNFMPVTADFSSFRK
jgi:hypothetical protein